MKGIAALALGLLCGAASTVGAQGVSYLRATAKLQGLVSGDVGSLQGAKVVLNNLTTGKSVSVGSDNCGRYLFRDLDPYAAYEIVATYGVHQSKKMRLRR